MTFHVREIVWDHGKPVSNALLAEIFNGRLDQLIIFERFKLPLCEAVSIKDKTNGGHVMTVRVASIAGRSKKTTNLEFQEEQKMPTGTVKWFNTQKGFGFIQPDDGGKDAFVHISAVERAGASSLNEGQKVSYDLVTDRGKTSAGNLKLLR